MGLEKPSVRLTVPEVIDASCSTSSPMFAGVPPSMGPKRYETFELMHDGPGK